MQSCWGPIPEALPRSPDQQSALRSPADAQSVELPKRVKEVKKAEDAAELAAPPDLFQEAPSGPDPAGHQRLGKHDCEYLEAPQ